MCYNLQCFCGGFTPGCDVVKNFRLLFYTCNKILEIFLPHISVSTIIFSFRRFRSLTWGPLWSQLWIWKIRVITGLVLGDKLTLVNIWIGYVCECTLLEWDEPTVCFGRLKCVRKPERRKISAVDSKIARNLEILRILLSANRVCDWPRCLISKEIAVHPDQIFVSLFWYGGRLFIQRVSTRPTTKLYVKV